jgi:Rrf2 family protein
VELLSKSEYALLALLELSACYHSGEPLQIRRIATLQNIPKRYLEQLLTALKCGGLIRSIRGSKGGYVLARDPWRLTMLDALNCIEGLDPATSVQNTTAKTIESQVIQEIWREACQASNSVLQKYTLQDLYERRTTRQQRGLMYYI